MRLCSKSRCRSRASLTVSLTYADREVHVGNLSPEPDPGLVDLCSEHARTLTPPIGWRIVWVAEPERVGV
ncbi:MAG TPA: DUF3499 family protein [Actinomycetota bacterium]